MEEQLNRAAFDFINDSSKNKISSNTVAISKIFKWYKDDFTEENNLTEYLNRYSDIKIQQGSEIVYLTYDWSLNER